MSKWLIASALGAAISSLAVSPASADTYSFGTNLSANNLANSGTGGQFKVDVTAVGTTQVQFFFYNVGPAASSICDIYFDDTSNDSNLVTIETRVLANIDHIVNGAGVSFTAGSASPPDLPAGNDATPDFEVTAGLLADSNSPDVQANGINPNENLAVIFNLSSGMTFSDLIKQLNNGVSASGYTSPALRMGIHVQAFANGGSESFINGTGTPSGVPLPSTAWAGIALLGFLAMGRTLFGWSQRAA